MPYLILSVLLQAALIVHVMRTGRNTIWIWAIALIPLAGSLAYIVVELLPSLKESRAARRAMRGVQRAIDPQRDLRHAENAARITRGVAAQQQYADELVKQQRFAEAVDVYHGALTGLYANDPNLLLGLAGAYFECGDFAAARQTLDRLIAENPDFKSPQGHLLYARALEGQGDTPKALEEYRVLAGYFPGAEAGVRYARLLMSQGQADDARRVLQELVDAAAIAPRHYRESQKLWLDEARRSLRT